MQLCCSVCVCSQERFSYQVISVLMLRQQISYLITSCSKRVTALFLAIQWGSGYTFKCSYINDHLRSQLTNISCIQRCAFSEPFPQHRGNKAHMPQSTIHLIRASIESTGLLSLKRGVKSQHPGQVVKKKQTSFNQSHSRLTFSFPCGFKTHFTHTVM